MGPTLSPPRFRVRWSARSVGVLGSGRPPHHPRRDKVRLSPPRPGSGSPPSRTPPRRGSRRSPSGAAASPTRSNPRRLRRAGPRVPCVRGPPQLLLSLVLITRDGAGPLSVRLCPTATPTIAQAGAAVTHRGPFASPSPNGLVLALRTLSLPSPPCTRAREKVLLAPSSTRDSGTETAGRITRGLQPRWARAQNLGALVLLALPTLGDAATTPRAGRRG